MPTNLIFPTTSREPSLNTKEFGTARGTIMKNFLMKLWKRLCLNPFSQGEGKYLADPMASCCKVIWGLTFSPLLNCYIQIQKFRLRLIRAWPNFYMIIDNPNVSLGIVDCSLHTRRFALKDVITRNERTCMLTLRWRSTNWKLLQSPSSFLPDKTSSFEKTFSTMLQFVGLLLQWIQTLHSLDLILKIHSGINSLISDKLKYSEEVSQL